LNIDYASKVQYTVSFFFYFFSHKIDIFNKIFVLFLIDYHTVNYPYEEK